MELAKTTWTKVEEYLKNKQTLIVPVGSTEQHGPTALIGTDFMTADAVAKKVGEITKTLVAPALNYGMANHHIGFAGSASLNPSTYIKVNMEILESWINQGFKNFVYINGHGGNIAPLSCAFSELKRKYPQDLKIGVFDWWHLKEVTDYEDEHFGIENGHHATCGEVSLTQFVHPDAFEKIDSQNFKVSPSAHHWPLSGQEMKKYHPDGRMDSNPGLSTPDHGEKLFHLASNAISEKIVKLGYV